MPDARTTAILAVAVIAAASGCVGLAATLIPDDPAVLVTVGAGGFAYRVSGEFLDDGQPADAPLATVTFDRPIAVMARPVSQREYAACVAAGACAAIGPGDADDRPVVGVSWRDATAYAAWLSRRTGHRYRLPTDAEWAYAAAERFHDDALAMAGDAANPAARWIAAYESESTIANVDPNPAPFGSFGTNGRGLVDVAGNVWEWTDTCYARHAFRDGEAATTVETCGVRVVEGAHRTYMSDFVRDARGGACSVGPPPANFGMRLVREDGGWTARLAAGLRRLLPSADDARTSPDRLG